jgi:hypothetical protein
MNPMRIFSSFLVPLAAVVFFGCGSNPVWQRQRFGFAIPSDSPSSLSNTNITTFDHLTVSPQFDSRSFTYRTAEDTYEHDPYASFMISPDRALAQAIRARLRNGGVFGRVLEQGGGMTSSVVVEASVSELDGDFRDPSHPLAAMTIHFIVYQLGLDGPGRVLLDKVCTCRTPLARRTPAAVIAAWDADLSKIMDELNSDYAKANLNDR